MGRRGPKPRRKVPPEWSADVAYAVGLFATDGCLYNNGRHLSFVSRDIELVQTFKRCLKIPTRITYKLPRPLGVKCPHVQFGDVTLYKFFRTIGIHPNKSKTIGELRIPKEFFFDFLRGALDGDGSFYSYFDPRWRSSFMYYLVLASASPAFIQWIRRELQQLLGVRGHVTNAKRSSCLQLKYAKAESFKIIKKVYYSSRVPCLMRKRVKIMTALRRARDSVH